MEEIFPRLVVGLGNPGVAYEMTRHNIGFQVVKALAMKNGWTFHKKPPLEGDLAQGVFKDQKVFLLLPSTYMNCSGESVHKCMQYLKIELQHLLVIVDDIYLPLGKLRLRKNGSAGGHNGLKSIEKILSQDYARLKIGVGQPQQEDLADYVLGQFTPEEGKQCPEIIQHALHMIEAWVGTC